MTTFSDFHQEIRQTPTYVILGVQGSGTNLISNILGKIFNVSVVRDRSLILSAAGRLVGDASLRNVERTFRYVHSCLFPGPLRRRWLPHQWFHQAKNYVGIEKEFDASQIKSAADFADFCYDYHAFHTKGDSKGIKSDDCWQHLDRIAEVIPNRRYILITRDPRDNLLSVVNKDFGPRTIYTGAHFVKHQLGIYLGEVAKMPNESLVTQYETLLREPEVFVNEFAGFSGLSVPGDCDERLDELRIRRENSQKWRGWTERQIGVAEAVLGDEMNQTGYEVQSSPAQQVSTMQAAGYRIKDVLMRIPQRLGTIWEHKVLAK